MPVWRRLRQEHLESGSETLGNGGATVPRPARWSVPVAMPGGASTERPLGAPSCHDGECDAVFLAEAGRSPRPLRTAHEHNLRGLDLPRQSLVVITGVAASGTSSRSGRPDGLLDSDRAGRRVASYRVDMSRSRVPPVLRHPGLPAATRGVTGCCLGLWLAGCAMHPRNESQEEDTADQDTEAPGCTALTDGGGDPPTLTADRSTDPETVWIAYGSGYCLDSGGCYDTSKNYRLSQLDGCSEAAIPVEEAATCSLVEAHLLGVVGDIDGDGQGEIATSSIEDGMLRIVAGGDCETSMANISSSSVGLSGVTGQVEDDEGGYAMLAFGTQWDGTDGHARAWLLPSESQGNMSLTDLAVLELEPSGVTHYWAYDAHISDIDGDGVSDVLVVSGGTAARSDITVFNGPVRSAGATSADLTLPSEEWINTADVADLNGDGYVDLAFLLVPYPTTGEGGGVGVVFGPMSDGVSLDEAPVSISGFHLGDPSAIAIGGDVTGDGDPDLVIGSRSDDPGDKARAGAIYVYSSPGPGHYDPGPVDVVAPGDMIDGTLGSSLVFIDLSDDGTPDLLVSGETSRSAVLIIPGF